MSMDETRLAERIATAVNEGGAIYSGVLVYIGDRLGLYQALAGAGPLTARELAERTGTSERYVREWCNNQAAGGWLRYHPDRCAYELLDEDAHLLADENSPVFLAGMFQAIAAAWAGADRMAEAFRTGEGVGWGEHDHRLFRGTERFFRPLYRSALTTAWIPAFVGIEAVLDSGGRVVDVGCGHGASTIVMAQAYPESTFVGFDAHEPSIVAARKAASESGVAERVDFEVASAQDYPGTDYDLVCFLDCLHDMGDPVGAAAHARATLGPDGAVMLVEPMASDRTEDNFNPVGRLFYAASTMFCTPSSLAQEVGLGLGAQAGEARLTEVLAQAGFNRVRRATETPFNLILEARP